MLIKKFEEKVAMFPENIAVETDNRMLTYDELNRCANKIANEIIKTDYLFPKNHKKQIAALLFEHGVDMIMGVLGELKAGKIYVPLDITYPENRLVYMLENSESYMILTNNKNLPLAKRLAGKVRGNLEIVNIDAIDNNVSDENIKRNPSGDALAYILYTSGSTGKPKGVIQNHRNVLYYIKNWTTRFSISASDRMTLFSAFSHDGAGQDLFGALHNGAALYPRNIKEDVNSIELSSWLIEKKITIWHSVPTLYRYFVNTLNNGEYKYFSDLRFILLGGEQIREHDLDMFKKYFPNAVFANVYGQTESSVNSIWIFHPEDSFNKVLVGEPLDKTKLFIINEDGGIIEDFGTGEIFAACECIALGYWKDSERSKKVFLHDPNLGRLYRTGDLGRLISKGCIEVLGRIDSQIKIRGYRVEIGEIETALLDHEAVKEAVVIAKEPKLANGEKANSSANYDVCLCAYVVSDEVLKVSELREHLSRELPDYMIPTRIVQLNQMPLTPTNKIDRKALLEGEVSGIDLESVYLEPRHPVEVIMVRIWKEVLKIDKVGVHDNFFELGGNSLNLLEVESKLKETFEIDIPFGSIFTYPTIGSLVQYIGQEEMVEGFSNVENDWFNKMKNGRNKLKTQKRKRIVESQSE